MITTVAYVYVWYHLPTLMWYIGSRTAKGCYPGDGYICSSKKVKPLILESTNEWKQVIIATGSVQEMIDLETEILQSVDAKHDPRSFNKHNGDGKFSVAGKKVYRSDAHSKAISQSNKGRVAWNKGLKMPVEFGLAKSISMTGKKRKPHTDETKLKISQTEKNTKLRSKEISSLALGAGLGLSHRVSSIIPESGASGTSKNLGGV